LIHQEAKVRLLTILTIGALIPASQPVSALAQEDKPEKASEQETALCSTWDVEIRNRSQADATVYPYLGDDVEELKLRSTVEEAPDLGVQVGTVQKSVTADLEMTGSRPVLVFFAVDTDEASGFSPARLAGWASPEKTVLRRIRGLRVSFSCEDD
jgi:hypothetical protein